MQLVLCTAAQLPHPQQKSQGRYKTDRPEDGAGEHDRHLVSVIATMLWVICRSVGGIVLA